MYTYIILHSLFYLQRFLSSLTKSLKYLERSDKKDENENKNETS